MMENDNKDLQSHLDYKLEYLHLAYRFLPVEEVERLTEEIILIQQEIKSLSK